MARWSLRVLDNRYRWLWVPAFAGTTAVWVTIYRLSMNSRSRGAHLWASRPDAEWPYSLSSRK